MSSIKEITSESLSELPWLVFKLKDLTYTINSRIVTGLVQLTENVTPVASAPEIFRGILNFRGEVLPLLDLRKFFGMPNTAEERRIFTDFIEVQKKDHIELVSELEHFIAHNEPFSKAADAHLCRLGRWCENPQNEAGIDSKRIRSQLKAMEKPHEELHECAKQILAGGIDDKQKFALIDKAKKYMQETLDLLDDMVREFNDSYREMIVVASTGSVSLGIIVDEVVAVDTLEILSDAEHFPSFQEKKFFNGIAHSTKVPGEILLVSEQMIMETFDHYKDAV